MKRVGLLCGLLVILMVCSFAQPVRLQMIQVFTSPGRTLLFEGIIRQFEAQNPGVTIELISPPYETAYNKIFLMVTTEQPLDIVEIGDWSLSGMASTGKLESLEPWIAKSPNTKYWLDGVLDSARIYQDTAYIVPNALYVKTLFIRPDILSAYGFYQPPATMHEMFYMAQAITDPTKNQFGFNFRGINPTNFIDLVMTSFFDDIDPECIYKTTSGKLIFDDPRAEEGLNFYVQLYQKTSPRDSINWGFDAQVNSFVSGIAPILFQDPDTTALLNNLLVDGEYRTAPLPVGPGGKAYPTMGFGGWAIPTYSQNKEWAWKFIEFFNSPEISATFCREYGALPIDSRVYEIDSYFRSPIFEGWTKMFDDPKRWQVTAYPLDNEAWFEWYQYHGDTMQQVLLGRMTVKQALQRWSQFWKDAGL